MKPLYQSSVWGKMGQFTRRKPLHANDSGDKLWLHAITCNKIIMGSRPLNIWGGGGVSKSRGGGVALNIPASFSISKSVIWRLRSRLCADPQAALWGGVRTRMRHCWCDSRPVLTTIIAFLHIFRIPPSDITMLAAPTKGCGNLAPKSSILLPAQPR